MQNLYERYQEAANFIGTDEKIVGTDGKNTKSTKLATDHYMKYLGFWNRLDFFYNIFRYGFDQNQFVSSLKISVDDVARTLQICYALCFVHFSFYPYLQFIVKRLDELNTVREDVKWEIFEKLLRGCLSVVICSASDNYNMNNTQYLELRNILLVASSWKWKNWIYKSSPSIHLVFSRDEWIGQEISYVPIVGFDKLISIYWEDLINIDKDFTVSAFIKKVNEDFNNQRGGVMEILRKQNDLTKKKTFEIERHDDRTINATSELKTVYTFFEKKSWMFQDLIRILKFAFERKWKTESVELAVNTITKIHDLQDNAMSTSIQDQYQIIIKKVIPLIGKLNTLTLKTTLVPRDRSMVSLDGQNLLKLMIGSFQTRDITWISESWSDLLVDMQTKSDEWHFVAQEFRTNEIEDYSQTFAIIEYCIVKWRMYATEIEKQWTKFRMNMQNIPAEQARALKINKIDAELSELIAKFVYVFKNIGLDIAYNATPETKRRMQNISTRSPSDYYPYIYIKV